MKIDKLVMQATRLQEAGKQAQAAAVFSQVLRQDPHNFVALYSLGVSRYAHEDFEGALSFFNRAAKRQPGFVPLLFNLSLTHLKLGASEEALGLLKRCLELDRSYQPAIKQLELLQVSLDGSAGNEAQAAAGELQKLITQALELQAANQPEQAEGAFSRLARTKRRRGYGDAGVNGNG